MENTDMDTPVVVPIEYKIIEGPMFRTYTEIEADLNKYAKENWVFNGSCGNAIILIRYSFPEVLAA